MFSVIVFAPYVAFYAVRVILIMLGVFLIAMGDEFSSISRFFIHSFNFKSSRFVSISLCNASYPLFFVITSAGFLFSFIHKISMISLRS